MALSIYICVRVGKIVSLKFVVVISVAILLGLGVWQLFRWDYKITLISDIKNKETLAAITIKNLDNIAELKHRKVILRGQLINDKSIYYYSLRSNTPGYELITPLKVSESSYILVNRGWSPEKVRLRASNKKNVTISGYIMELPKKSIFSPKNNLTSNLWLSFDLQDIKKFMGISVKPVILMLDTEKYLTGKMANPQLNQIPNNHLGYALTWFATAIALLIMYILGNRKRNEHE